MRIDVAAQTDIGRRKRKNEDSFGVFQEDTPNLQLFQEGGLLCVADGLGGHIGGEIASKLAVSMIKDALSRSPEPPPSDSEAAEEDPQGYLAVLRGAFQRANDSIHRTNQDLMSDGRPMGTTLLAVLVVPKRAYIGNVGDSRCYHVRDGEIIARTEDHSWVDEQVKLGLMSKAEAEVDSRKNMVTRCIGTHPEVEMDTYVWHLVPGDMLLLCTDGLVNMVKDSDIKAQFARNSAPAEIVHNLVEMANENGGKDNITVIVADISPSLRTMLARRIRWFSKRKGAKVVAVLLALLYGGLCFLAGFLIGRGG